MQSGPWFFTLLTKGLIGNAVNSSAGYGRIDCCSSSTFSFFGSSQRS
jgi:hypothetical protein